MPKRNLAWILVIVMITFLMWQLPKTIAGRDSVYEAFGPLVAVRAEIHKRSVRRIDDAELTEGAVTAGIRAMVEELNDVHAAYLTQREYELFRKRTNGVFGGVGVDVWPAAAGLEVLSRAPGSPAARAGILPGEIITHVDGSPTQGVSLVEAVNSMLGGSIGTEVTLTVARPGAEPESSRLVRLRRTLTPLDPIRGWSRSPSGGWRFMLDAEVRIGYVRLTKFTPDVADRMDVVVHRLLRDRLRGLVLDLRENPGGILESGIDVADRFIDSGLLVTKRGRKAGISQWNASRESTYPPFRMAVLINGSSASAAELVAGALRDHRRAAIVGERSYGKGSVQEVVELGSGDGALKLTIAHYFLPNGQCIDRTPEELEMVRGGIEPTLPVVLTDPQRGRWLAAWREISREVVADASSQEAAHKPEPHERAELAAAALLEADIQLRKAVEHLRQRIAPTPSGSDDGSRGVPRPGG